MATDISAAISDLTQIAHAIFWIASATKIAVGIWQSKHPRA